MAIYFDICVVYFHWPISISIESFVYGLRLIHRHQIDFESPILVVSRWKGLKKPLRLFPQSKLFDKLVDDFIPEDDENEDLHRDDESLYENEYESYCFRDRTYR